MWRIPEDNYTEEDFAKRTDLLLARHELCDACGGIGHLTDQFGEYGPIPTKEHIWCRRCEGTGRHFHCLHCHDTGIDPDQTAYDPITYAPDPLRCTACEDEEWARPWGRGI